MRNNLLEACRLLYRAGAEKHRINIEVMLHNPTAIPEHSDIMTAVEKEITSLAEYMDKLEVLDKYFSE